MNAVLKGIIIKKRIYSEIRQIILSNKIVQYFIVTLLLLLYNI